MTNKRLTPCNAEWPVCNAVFAVLIICFYALCLALPERWAALYETYGKVLIISMIALYFWHAKFKGYLELRIVLFYCIWLLITRILNGDTYLQNEFDLVLAKFLCFVVMASAFFLENKQRERFFDVVIAIYCGIFFVAALIGLFCCSAGCYIVLPPEGTIFGIDREIEYVFTNFVGMFSTIRNISAAWTYTAWCLMTYEFAKTHSKLWRSLIAIAWLVFTLSVMMSYSRTMNIAFAVSCAMLAMLIVMHRFDFKRFALKAAVVAAAGILALGISYKSVDYVKPVFGSVSVSLTASMPRESNDIIHFHSAVSSDFSDQRNDAANVASLSGRTDVYRAALNAIVNERESLIKGRYSFKLPLSLRRYLPPNDIEPIEHAHNYLLQTALLTGIIGFAAVLLFTVFTVLRMVIMFFIKDERISLADKILTIPLAGLFIYSMMEIMIFTNCSDSRSFGTDLRELMFFLIAGMFLARYYDVFPSLPKCSLLKSKESENG